MVSHETTALDSAPAPADPFTIELRRWRDVRGMSRAALARTMGYDRSYVSKIESGSERPSKEFAAHAELALRAGGALLAAFRERKGTTRSPRPLAESSQWEPAGVGTLVVDHDDALLRYDDGVYRLTQRRRLVNNSSEPVARYLIRISVDRYPGDPERSNQLYAANPLTWEEIGLRAWCGQGRTERMEWSAHHDRDAFKEVWLRFAGPSGRFPLYPGEAVWIEYEYTVADEHWGQWFQRAVRLPTNKLSVCLDFPADLAPVVWGLHTSMTAEALPLQTAIARASSGDRHVFSWACDNPPLHARYRLEWDFRKWPAPPDSGPAAKPSATMASLGVIQDGDPILHKPARRFDLPAEAEDARRVIAALGSARERVATAHTFGKGMGIAAPQIGVDPAVVETGGEVDEQYEGCLSFFDVRGMVPRPHVVHVEHTDVDGNKQITIFERGVARLVAHEVDHLHGIIYTDRMRPGASPIPVEQYRGTGTAWRY